MSFTLLSLSKLELEAVFLTAETRETRERKLERSKRLQEETVRGKECALIYWDGLRRVLTFF